MSLESHLFDNIDFEVRRREDELKLKCLEVWYHEEKSISPVLQDLQPSQVEAWLNKANPPNLVGGLRLVIQEDPEVDHETLNLISEKLNLSKAYLFDFQVGYPVATRLREVYTGDGSRTKISIVCQTPSYPDMFMTFALTYDPLSNITTGYLGYTIKNKSKYPLLTSLCKAARDIPHPILLSVLILSFWCTKYQLELNSIADGLRGVQAESGLLEKYLRDASDKSSDPVSLSNPEIRERNDDESDQRAKLGPNDIHKQLVEQHTHLSNSKADFAADLAASTLEALDYIQRTNGDACGKHEAITRCNEELRACVLQMQGLVNAVRQQKQKLLSRVDMQLKVLYHMMQQNDNDNNYTIALETKKDSAAMYSISIMTMLFLPSTAIAAIFSMSPFFSSSPAADLIISSQFWIYWAIAIPLTTLVIVTRLLMQARHSRRQRKGDVEENVKSSHLEGEAAAAAAAAQLSGKSPRGSVTSS